MTEPIRQAMCPRYDGKPKLSVSSSPCNRLPAGQVKAFSRPQTPSSMPPAMALKFAPHRWQRWCGSRCGHEEDVDADGPGGGGGTADGKDAAACDGRTTGGGALVPG